MSLRSLLLLVIAVAGCGGDDAADLDLSSRDPRCVAACPETMQTTAGVGDVCDTQSRVQCLDTCEARIAGLMPACQTCLTEDACFDPDHCEGQVGTFCGNGSGTVSGWNGTCSYTCGDNQAYTNCLKQVSPTREVTCTADFKPLSECSTECN